MPADKVSCPLCPSAVPALSRNNLGVHLTSRQHIATITDMNAKNIPKWIKDAAFLLDPPKFPTWPELPKVTLGKSSEYYYMCFGCKKTYTNPTIHFEGNKDSKAALCRQSHAQAVMSLFNVEDPLVKVKRLEEEIALLKSQGTRGPAIEVKETEEYKELLQEKEENEVSAEKTLGESMMMNSLLKHFFPTKMDYDERMVLYQKMVEKFKSSPPAPYCESAAESSSALRAPKGGADEPPPPAPPPPAPPAPKTNALRFGGMSFEELNTLASSIKDEDMGAYVAALDAADRDRKNRAAIASVGAAPRIKMMPKQVVNRVAPVY